MHNSHVIQRFLSGLLFVSGVLFALLLAVVSFWPDQEASIFDSSLSAQAPLNTLRCPLVITPNEAAAIRVTLTNPLERPIQLLARARISDGYVTLMRQETRTVPLAPGETQTVSWPITGEDAVYGRFVLARVYVFRQNPLPSRQKSCGVWFLDAPLVTGGQLAAATAAASFLGMAVGGAWWLRLEWPLRGRRRDVALAVGTLAALVSAAAGASLLGWWSGGLLLLLLTILVLIVLLERYFLTH
ncbi:MAG: hypothetical protein Fur0021_19290 [Candidatus Promineifilaceae bacterium]